MTLVDQVLQERGKSIEILKIQTESRGRESEIIKNAVQILIIKLFDTFQ